MAKIYETKEDFERDKLKEQAAALDNKALRQSGFGIAITAVGLFLHNLNLGKIIEKGKSSTALYVSYTIASIVGIVEVARSWFTASKSHDLKLERERMGASTEVHMFNDSPIPNMLAANNQDCCTPKYTQNIQPTSLLEQASKSDSIMQQK